MRRWWRPQAGGSDPLAEAVRLPVAGIYLHWGIAGPAAERSWELEVTEDPGASVGEYLAVLNGTIDGQAMYLGLQTDVFSPGAGRRVGKGAVFSTWWTFDLGDARPAPGGFTQAGTHEGRFIGVRALHDWGVGRYRLRLARGAPDDRGGQAGDWFELSLTDLGGGATVGLGALRFARRAAGRPASIDPGGVGFVEVYSHAARWADVPRLGAALGAAADGVTCEAVRIEYPRFADGQQMPNAAARWDPATRRVELRFGGHQLRRPPVTRR
jgi:hypothetical protein